MAARRNRPSLDAVAGSSNVNKNSTLEAFEDFRRRHSRQNKDIVIDNALRRTTVKTLQDEIGKLHIELLQLRQANVYLSSQVKRLQIEATRSCSNTTKDAIDQILAAVPALRQFRDSLRTSPLSPISGGIDGIIEKGWTIESKENPTATRPAAHGENLRRQGNLAPLVETSEYGSDDGEILPPSIDERRIRRMSKGRRRTEIGSVALRSPRPTTRLPPSDYFVVDSPPSTSRPAPPLTLPSPSSSLSESPSPVKQRATSPEKRTKKRRESGRLPLPSARDLAPVLSSPPDMEEIPDWDEGKNTVGSPVKGVSESMIKSNKQTAGTSKIKEIAKALSTTAINGSPSTISVENTIGLTETPGGTAGSKGKVKAPAAMSTVIEETGRPGASSLGPALGDTTTYSEIDTMSFISDDDIGRGRRARRSVNYKEPSLTKKMRKPDGVSAEEALRPRQSLSAIPTHIPDTPGNATTIPSLKSTESKRALHHLSGPRRKSVLPRHGGLNHVPAVDDEEDEIDVDLDLHLGGGGYDSPEERPMRSIKSSKDDDYVPSSPGTTVKSISPPSAPIVSKRPITSKVSSPRKPAIPRTNLAIGKVSSTGAAGAMGGRGTLTVRPDDNGRKVPSAVTSAKGAGVVRRTISSTRKAAA